MILPSTSGTGTGTGQVAPDHLVVWLAGVSVDPDSPEFVHDHLDDDFSLRAWVDRIRSRSPAAALGTVHEGSTDADGWWPAIRAVATAPPSGRGQISRGVAEASSLADQRAVVREALESMRAGDDHPWMDTAIDDVVLAMDELIVNVDQHAMRRCGVHLLPSQSTVTVGVTDDSPDRVAVRRDVAPSALGGRGLVVIEHLSCAWGQVIMPSTKTVWAQLPLWTADA